MKKELLKITVELDEDENNSLIVTAEYDETDDVFGNLAFTFIVFCKDADMTTKEGLAYLKKSVELWEKYRRYKDANTNS